MTTTEPAVQWEVEGLGTRPTDAAVSAMARLLLSIAEKRIAARAAQQNQNEKPSAEPAGGGP